MSVRRYRLSPVCHPARVSRLTLLETFQIVRELGGEGQNRTVDTTIFSRMLYQLSYLATSVAAFDVRQVHHYTIADSERIVAPPRPYPIPPSTPRAWRD